MNAAHDIVSLTELLASLDDARPGPNSVMMR
jgi:hypothetical protein